jgi:hypothetical protein
MDTQAAILSDGTINLDRLITEIQSDLFNDAKYKAEDGMKKRAVHISEFQIIFFALSTSHADCHFIHFDEPPFSNIIPLLHSYGTGKNYDEFKEFVACSQLKPIKGLDNNSISRAVSSADTEESLNSSMRACT